MLVALQAMRELPSSGALDAELLGKADRLESRLMADELTILESEEALLWR